ncbi:MAG TPA: hypothetical protein VIX12_09535 [Candidatus Binataceae bacterium]
MRRLLAVMMLLSAGCGELWGNSITETQFFSAEEPVAILTIHERSAAIDGRIHGWPFAHFEPNGDVGEGLFSYCQELTVTVSRDGRPMSARGVETVYFHPDRERFDFRKPDSFTQGEPIERTTVLATFEFSADGQQVSIRTLEHQVRTYPFSYNGRSIVPPNRADHSELMTGYYSEGFHAFLIRNSG